MFFSIYITYLLRFYKLKTEPIQLKHIYTFLSFKFTLSFGILTSIWILQTSQLLLSHYLCHVCQEVLLLKWHKSVY